ncbi:twin-arginine translocase subunit TatC [Brevibacillus humidisoli]|uniref:twin-arginine translocase subunit TatC n=1 Tax=Brevibacillus humidisoli TaxID=2895522 RepID=UPI001E57AEF9|nr:twin-arginine translocase subunit TatC [Brevibacillus humidisoli]UFJ40966.1 twin-arginine translocase subunit TatC [Brevibacillus humidisoli]
MSEIREMTLEEHLGELRKRIIWVLVVFVLALVVGLFYADVVIQYMQSNPISQEIPLSGLVSLSPSDALRVYMQFAFLIGVVITLPVALFQIWRFVSPGLRPPEQRVALRFIPVAFLLFLLGLGFGYYIVFPMILPFMVGFTEKIGTQPLYGVAEYFGFMFNIVIPFGFLFELPMLVMFLTRLRIVNPMRLARLRRVAYFVLAVVAITLTPPEIVSDILVTIPLLLLYEVSIWLSKLVYRKQLQEDEAWEREFADRKS